MRSAFDTQMKQTDLATRELKERKGNILINFVLFVFFCGKKSGTSSAIGI